MIRLLQHFSAFSLLLPPRPAFLCPACPQLAFDKIFRFSLPSPACRAAYVYGERTLPFPQLVVTLWRHFFHLLLSLPLSAAFCSFGAFLSFSGSLVRGLFSFPFYGGIPFSATDVVLFLIWLCDPRSSPFLIPSLLSHFSPLLFSSRSKSDPCQI